MRLEDAINVIRDRFETARRNDTELRNVIAVTGGRDYRDSGTVVVTLGSLCPISKLIHGGCTGADVIAGEWASQCRIEVVEVPADWKTHGKSAGPIRNSKMVGMMPDFVVAFPGGRGTANMVSQSRSAGLTVITIT